MGDTQRELVWIAVYAAATVYAVPGRGMPTADYACKVADQAVKDFDERFRTAEGWRIGV